ncbi:Tetratricopeptide repeat protein 8 [Eumeta japonica]|uniref:Tetratricopeptide repeat protein 8 n=1 Tax=Eumeta variegata TaxID=151549 RepID=A0A4C1UA68_EUMVA|nr:Tetratricopeptide repeat protein 8 [Eumeta japonica]
MLLCSVQRQVQRHDHEQAQAWRERALHVRRCSRLRVHPRAATALVGVSAPFTVGAPLTLTLLTKEDKNFVASAKTFFEYVFYCEGDVRKAMEIAAQAQKVETNLDWWWNFSLAKCYNVLRMHRNAEDCLRQALKQNKHIGIYLRLTAMYVALNQPLAALETCKHGLVAFPEDTSLTLEKARILDEMGNTPLAVNEYRKVAVYDATNVEAVASIAMYNFYNDQPEIAMRYYSTWQERDAPTQALLKFALFRLVLMGLAECMCTAIPCLLRQRFRHFVYGILRKFHIKKLSHVTISTWPENRPSDLAYLLHRADIDLIKTPFWRRVSRARSCTTTWVCAVCTVANGTSRCPAFGKRCSTPPTPRHEPTSGLTLHMLPYSTCSKYILLLPVHRRFAPSAALPTDESGAAFGPCGGRERPARTRYPNRTHKAANHK